MPELDLKLVPDNELLNELLSRFDHCGFIGLRVLTGHPNGHGDQEFKRRWVGNPHAVMGLCQDLGLEVLADFMAREDEGRDDAD